MSRFLSVPLCLSLHVPLCLSLSQSLSRGLKKNQDDEENQFENKLLISSINKREREKIQSYFKWIEIILERLMMKEKLRGTIKRKEKEEKRETFRRPQRQAKEEPSSKYSRASSFCWIRLERARDFKYSHL